jgi:hypothetical protein
MSKSIPLRRLVWDSGIPNQNAPSFSMKCKCRIKVNMVFKFRYTSFYRSNSLDPQSLQASSTRSPRIKAIISRRHNHNAYQLSHSRFPPISVTIRHGLAIESLLSIRLNSSERASKVRIALSHPYRLDPPSIAQARSSCTCQADDLQFRGGQAFLSAMHSSPPRPSSEARTGSEDDKSTNCERIS